MNKVSKALAAFLLSCGVVASFVACGAPADSSSTSTSTSTSTGQTDTLTPLSAKIGIGGYEWGPAGDMVMFEVDGTVTAADLATVKFTTKSGDTDLKFKEAYPCDANGIKVTTPSQYFAVKFTAKTNQLSPFSYGKMADAANEANTWNNNGTANVTVTLTEGTLKVTKGGTTNNYTTFNYTNRIKYSDRVVPSTATMKKSTYTKDDKTLQYAAYETAEMKADKGKNPLIIWLHGAGEGGTDVDIALLGNDVTNLTEEKIQSHFVNDNQKGAYVLAVQTPTMWMNAGVKGNDGKYQYTTDGTSIYLETLMETIKNYAEKENTDVDLNRIYIGGCSNGGYMTMNMMINYGDYFAAAYPICEAYSDSWITDAQLEKLATRNIWFTHSANDTTVKPSGYTNATYIRMLKAGATSTYFSYFESVLGTDDPTAKNWFGGGGNYTGHYSWIYTLQDKCTRVQPTNATAATELKGSNANGGGTWNVQVNGKTETLWGWMAAQVKGQKNGTAVADPELN